LELASERERSVLLSQTCESLIRDATLTHAQLLSSDKKNKGGASAASGSMRSPDAIPKGAVLRRSVA
jgi:hypothetical protein